MKDVHEVVAAFADGEPVDPDRLDAALADAEGRAHLIELLALRGLIERSAAAPDPLAVPTVRQVPAWLHRWPAAAAVALACLAAGFAAGQMTAAPGEASNTRSEIHSTAGVTGLVAPEPSTVIRLEPGVDWQEEIGGN